MKTNKFGVASLVCGIMGILIFPYLLSTLAIIFGAIGMHKGERFSTAGLVLGIAGWMFYLLLLVLLLLL